MSFSVFYIFNFIFFLLNIKVLILFLKTWIYSRFYFIFIYLLSKIKVVFFFFIEKKYISNLLYLFFFCKIDQ